MVRNALLKKQILVCFTLTSHRSFFFLDIITKSIWKSEWGIYSQTSSASLCLLSLCSPGSSHRTSSSAVTIVYRPKTIISKCQCVDPNYKTIPHFYIVFNGKKTTTRNLSYIGVDMVIIQNGIPFLIQVQLHSACWSARVCPETEDSSPPKQADPWPKKEPRRQRPWCMENGPEYSSVFLLSTGWGMEIHWHNGRPHQQHVK